MANFQAVERSNYVRFRPEMLALVTAYCAAFNIRLNESDGRHALLPDGRGEDDAFGSICDEVSDELFALLSAHKLLEEAGLHWVDPDSGSDEEEEIELDLSLLATWMAPGEVLVIESAGCEKLRYLAAFALAYNHKGDEVQISLQDIYAKAADAFGVEVNAISQASY